jgi:hypothetical protein
VEPRQTKAELGQEIASLRARVNEKKVLMDRSVGVRRRIAQIESGPIQAANDYRDGKAARSL